MNKSDMEKLAELVAGMVVEQMNAQQPDTPSENSVYMTTSEVAQMTGLKKVTLERYRAVRKGPRYFKVGANVRYLQADVRAWMEAQPIAS